jgi:hypothetical protein
VQHPDETPETNIGLQHVYIVIATYAISQIYFYNIKSNQQYFEDHHENHGK